jgi:hypothetical protein
LSLGFGFGVWGLGFGVWGLGFGVWGLVIGVWGLEFGNERQGFRVDPTPARHLLYTGVALHPKP